MERDLSGADRDAGVALIMTVSILTAILALSATAVAAVLSNITESRKANATTAAHATAEAGADEFFARVVRDPNYFAVPAGGGSPPYLAAGTADAGYAPAWATLVNGAPQTCADPYSSVCYQVEANVEAQPGNPHATSVTVSVTSATLCPHGLAHLATCVTDTVHQRLVQRQFFDYLYFDQLETLDPALYPQASEGTKAARTCQVLAAQRPSSCIPVPFLGPTGSASGGDTVLGPIHTNDASFYVCLRPTFSPPVERSGWPSRRTPTGEATALESAGSPVFIAAPGAACAGASPHETGGPVSEVANAPYFSFAVDVADLARIPNPGDSYTGVTTVTLHGGNVPGRGTYREASGAVAAGAPGVDHPWPGTGVVYVDGDAYVSGDACDPISVVATGNIYIDGNLTYGPDSSCPSAATGLEANDAVVVLPTDGPTGPTVNGSTDRTIEAAVLALGRRSCYSPAAGGARAAPGVTCSLASNTTPRGGSFYVQGWNTTGLAAGQRPHSLHFLGAIATVWRGAIGAFDATTGQLASGWAKDFAFDRQLRTSQPPYFLAPVGAGWARTDLSATGPA